MHLPCVYIAALLPFLARGATLIPKTVFDNAGSLTQYFSYNYPWGTDHNGGARMDPAQAVISTQGTLTLTARPVTGQPPATHAGKQVRRSRGVHFYMTRSTY